MPANTPDWRKSNAGLPTPLSEMLATAASPLKTVGKASVNDIVVLRGLARGDSIIISDMSQMLTEKRVRLQ